MTTAVGQGQAVGALEEEGEKQWDILKPKVIGDGNTTYLERVKLLLTPWFSILLHRIYRPDNQRELHDHPWTFFSFIFWGWYREDTPGGMRVCRWFNFKLAEGLHSIRWTSRHPVWTLVFTGPRRRKWGFWVPVPGVWACPRCPYTYGRATFNANSGELRTGEPYWPEACPNDWTELVPVLRFVPWDEYPKLNAA
jgi:hypothetical protein